MNSNDSVQFLPPVGARIFQPGQVLVAYRGTIPASGEVTAGIPLSTEKGEPPGIESGLRSSFWVGGEGIERAEHPVLVRSTWWQRWWWPRVFARFTVKGPPNATFHASVVMNGKAFGFSYTLEETASGQLSVLGFIHLENGLGIALPKLLEVSLRRPVGLQTNLGSLPRANFPRHDVTEGNQSGLVGRRHAPTLEGAGGGAAFIGMASGSCESVDSMLAEFTDTDTMPGDSPQPAGDPELPRRQRLDLVPHGNLEESQTLRLSSPVGIPPTESRWFSFVHGGATARRVLLCVPHQDPRAHRAIWITSNETGQTLHQGVASLRLLQPDGRTLAYSGTVELHAVLPKGQTTSPYEIEPGLTVKRTTDSMAQAIESVSTDGGRPIITRRVVRSVTYRVARTDPAVTGLLLIEHHQFDSTTDLRVLSPGHRVERFDGASYICVELGTDALLDVTIEEGGIARTVVPRQDKAAMEQLFTALRQDPSRARGDAAKRVADLVKQLADAEALVRKTGRDLDFVGKGGPILAAIVGHSAGAPSAQPFVEALSRMAERVQALEGTGDTGPEEAVRALKDEVEGAVDAMFAAPQ